MKYYFVFFFIIINSCSYPEIISDELIYINDFENENLIEIDGGIITEYNGSRVIGNYNNDGFTLHLNELGSHDYIYVSFDLYIHGSWDGNFNGFSEEVHGIIDQPDLWGMELRPEMSNFQSLGFQRFETTFSNSSCWPNYCLKQSYPNTFPFLNNPKAGSIATNLKENCYAEGWDNKKTTLYKIEKGFNHKGNALIIRFYDNLFQPNAVDANGNSIEKCDESWSLDNLKIRAISYD